MCADPVDEAGEDNTMDNTTANITDHPIHAALFEFHGLFEGGQRRCGPCPRRQVPVADAYVSADPEAAETAPRADNAPVSEPDFAAQLAALRDMGFTDEALLTELLSATRVCSCVHSTTCARSRLVSVLCGLLSRLLSINPFLDSFGREQG